MSIPTVAVGAFVFDREGLVAIGDLVVAERFPGRLHWRRAQEQEHRG